MQRIFGTFATLRATEDGVEDIKLKAKDTKKSEAKDRNVRGQGQGPKAQMQLFS